LVLTSSGSTIALGSVGADTSAVPDGTCASTLGSVGAAVSTVAAGSNTSVLGSVGALFPPLRRRLWPRHRVRSSSPHLPSFTGLVPWSWVRSARMARGGSRTARMLRHWVRSAPPPRPTRKARLRAVLPDVETAVFQDKVGDPVGHLVVLTSLRRPGTPQPTLLRRGCISLAPSPIAGGGPRRGKARRHDSPGSPP
jgi:hypothetical protein